MVATDVAASWLETILALDWKRVESAAFAAAHIARMTGDRSRDLAEPLRERIIERMKMANAAPSWIGMVRATVELDDAIERRMLGDSLPPGLKLIG